MRTIKNIAYFFSICILIACSGQKENSHISKKPKGLKALVSDKQNEVEVMPLRYGTFHHELVSNGKIIAAAYADLSFETSAIVEKVYVKNGMVVHKGDVLARLNQFKLTNRVKEAELSISQSELEMKDVLIGQGYDPDFLEKIPKKVLDLAKIKSQYAQNQTRLQLAKYNLNRTTLVAPFDGIIANVAISDYNTAEPNKPVCRIIKQGAMKVIFTILESELSVVNIGEKVLIYPFADRDNVKHGKIDAINPIVDEQGMVEVSASIPAPKGLYSGMNVQLSVQRALNHKLIIPKTAVVLRSGREVVFTLEKDSLAVWNYVFTSLENTTQYIVSDKTQKSVRKGLKPGDVVIVSGNANLAHHAPVKVIDVLEGIK